jgi:hypothetical protein
MNERIGRSWCIIRLGDCGSCRLRSAGLSQGVVPSVSANIAPLIIRSAPTREDRKGLVTCGMDGCHFDRELYCRQMCSRGCITRLGLGWE